MATKPYTFEVATNAPKGVWKVADRTFWDKRLTLKERRESMAVPTDEAFLAAALTCLKVEGEPVTVEWVDEQLTEQDLRLTVAFVLGGQDGVEKHLKALADG